MATAYSSLLPKRDKLLTRWEALKAERSSWIPHWQDLSTNLEPRLGRFFVTDRNRGQQRHNSIYDSTGTRALRTLSAGLMAGMTSPARPWFNLSTNDQDLDKSHNVRVWLSACRKLMLNVFARSNTYRMLQGIYKELGLFGTGASLVLPDFNNVNYCYPSTVGEYAIATDLKGQVNTFYREYQKQVGPLVGEFGLGNVTESTKRLYDNGQLDQWITVIQAIEPRKDRDPQARDARNMPWASCHFELGCQPDKYLRVSGMRDFRVVAPRWDVTGSDIYGSSPAMEALGDVKQLQHEQLRKAQGIDYQTKPPVGAPTSLKGQEVNGLPGGVTYYDNNTPHGGIKPLWEVNLNLQYLLEDIRDVRSRINSTFYADLFLMLAQMPADGSMTATEVAERHEEKMLMLGPVLERLHDELLDPLVTMTFNDLVRAGAIPPPPPEMNGRPLVVEFISVLAQAQRAVGTAGLDRYVSNLGTVASFKPEVLDKFDADKWADVYADSLGVDPEIVVADEKVALIRQARAEAQQKAEAAAQANTAADTAAKLGKVPTGGAPNAANDILNGLQGYSSPAAESY